MINRIFLSTLFCIFTMVSVAQTYIPVLSDGKVWQYATVNCYERTDTTGHYKITVTGDTIINDFICKKIIVQNENMQFPIQTFVAYEDNGKVYKVEEGKLILLFDIGLKKGDCINNLAEVVGEYTKVINGKQRKVIVIDSMVDHSDGECLYYVIEGIGVSKDEFISNFNIGNDDDFCTLVSCTENGFVIDIASLGNIETSIESPKLTYQGDNMYYDLSGIKSQNPIKGNLYIHNGV